MPAAQLQAKSANHSPLMASLCKANLGAPPNWCPHGCADQDLDEQGYCKHLVGFTTPGDDKRMQPRLPRTNRDGQVVGYFVSGAAACPVPPGAKLEKITVCARVYHPDGIPGWRDPADDELEAATRPGG